MKTIRVDLKNNSYPIYIGSKILDRFAEVLAKYLDAKQIAVITSENIFELYGEKLLQNFDSSCQVKVIFVPQGEQAKSAGQVQELYTELLQGKFERDSLIIALGGGVIGDLAGFAAATYLRGVNLVQIPSTLLAQVDSSIGGKTGINHPLGKNLIGAFYQPLFVFSDVSLLQTLPDDEIRCGLGEVIKYGFILNKPFFKFLQDNIEKALNRDEETLLHLVEVSSRDKAEVVMKDEKESGLRMSLNFGHTFGHALEREFEYSGLKHGEAVIAGMHCALIYSYNENYITDSEFKAGRELLSRVPVMLKKNKLDPDKLLQYMTLDKKVRDKKIRLILINEIGKYLIQPDCSTEQIFKVWQKFIAEL